MNIANNLIALITGGVIVNIASSATVASIEAAIRSILIGDLTISGLVFSRIFPNQIPQGETIPCIVYEQVSCNRDLTSDGPSGLVNSRFQINCWAETYGKVKTLAKAVINALSGYSGTVSGIVIQLISPQDEGDNLIMPAGTDVLARYGREMEFEVWFTE